ncbi:hypothetical protein PMAYCL1PPCAC_11967 [Pristionchus mayeri]|uniref:Chromo domain-containing protein n=1 Tax=Pristionchus mayeri TaxID=1317129 RepID=A0AAN4ZNZ6_9BILA|nr:hypothetical protein PMAYCL1PPCAC_11967 [Pristionchus mayeri]
MGRRKTRVVAKGKDVDYVVEKILDKRTNKDGEVEYFIKWRGYPASHNKWEPASNVTCPDKIEEFERAGRGDGRKRKSTVADSASSLSLTSVMSDASASTSAKGAVPAKRPRGRPPKAKNQQDSDQSASAGAPLLAVANSPTQADPQPAAVAAPTVAVVPAADAANNSTPSQMNGHEPAQDVAAVPPSTAAADASTNSTAAMGPLVGSPSADEATSSAPTKRPRGRPRNNVPVGVVKPIQQPSNNGQRAAIVRPQELRAPVVVPRPPPQEDDSDVEVVMEVVAPPAERRARMVQQRLQVAGQRLRHDLRMNPQQQAHPETQQMMQRLLMAGFLVQPRRLPALQRMQQRLQAARQPLQQLLQAARRPMQHRPLAARQPMQNRPLAARQPMHQRPPVAGQMQQGPLGRRQRMGHGPIPPRPPQSVHSENDSDVEVLPQLPPANGDNEELPVVEQAEVQQQLQIIGEAADNEVVVPADAVEEEVEREQEESTEEPPEKEAEAGAKADQEQTIYPQEQKELSVEPVLPPERVDSDGEMEVKSPHMMEDQSNEWVDHYEDVGMEEVESLVSTSEVDPSEEEDLNYFLWSPRAIDCRQSVELAVKREHLELGETMMAGTVYFGEVPFEVGITVLDGEEGDEVLGIMVKCNEKEESSLWRIDATLEVDMVLSDLVITFDPYSFFKHNTLAKMELSTPLDEMMCEGSKYVDGEGTLLLNISVVLLDVQGYVLPLEHDFTKRRRHDNTIFDVEGTYVFVNRDQLSLRSEFFYKIFQERAGQDKEPIAVYDCSLDEFLLMLDKLFNYDHEIYNDTLIPLMHAAHLFELTDVLTSCHEYFYKHMYDLSTEQIVQAMQQVDDYADSDLERAVLEVTVRKNLFEEVKTTEGYKELSDRFKVYLLKRIIELEKGMEEK